MPLTAYLAFTYTPNNHRWISGMFYSSSYLFSSVAGSYA